MIIAKNRGGKRQNAGRKRLKCPTVRISVYIDEKEVEQAGGKKVYSKKIKMLLLNKEFKDGDFKELPIKKTSLVKKQLQKKEIINTEEKQKHPLWQSTHPKEGTMAFYMLFNVGTYEEIEK